MPDFTTTQALPATFAPAWARRMAAEEHWPAAGTSMPLAGAILFADISGFTALADRMSQLGPAGVEAHAVQHQAVNCGRSAPAASSAWAMKVAACCCTACR